MNATFHGSTASAKAESIAAETLKERYGEMPDPSSLSTEEYSAIVREVRGIQRAAELEARKQIMEELHPLAAESSTLKDCCEAYSKGVSVENSVFIGQRALRIKANSEQRPDLQLIQRLQERFSCTYFYLDEVSWTDWQEWGLSSYLQNAANVQNIIMSTVAGAEPELYTELAKILPRITGIRSLDVHGPSDERGFYRERIDMDSLKVMLDAMLQNPSLKRMELDARREEDHAALVLLLRGDDEVPVDFHWSNGGAGMIFDKRRVR